MGGAASGLLVMGRIGGPCGIRGWVRIHSFTEPAENLMGYGNCLLARAGGHSPLHFEESGRSGKGLVARLRGVADRAAAAALRGCDIAVPAAQLPALADGYYWHELQGLRVSCRGGVLGRVSHLLATGANDVLVVRPCPGSLDARERLIPWLRESVVSRVDLEAGALEVDWDPEF